MRSVVSWRSRNIHRATALILAALVLCGCQSGLRAPLPRPSPQPGIRIGSGAVSLAPRPSARPRSWRRSERSPPRVAAPSVIVENLDSGEVLFARDADRRRSIASLTKIMTAMVVLARTRPADVVRASRRAARQRPTSLGLRPGQRMNVHDLLYALLLHSSNDVAVALAEHVSGSVRAFDALMTRRGVQIGLSQTRFASPSGLNDQGYSTARDVAALTRWAYRSRTFAGIVATKNYRITLPSGTRVRLRNLNDLLFDYRGAIGVKTGFTLASRWSLVGVADRGGTRLMVVVLADPDKPFRDGEALLTWGFRAWRSRVARALVGTHGRT
jgi:serine-type D-Ala-D-Ala carboxypeptidase (penicillin-binding protein 5/6)